VVVGSKGDILGGWVDRNIIRLKTLPEKILTSSKTANSAKSGILAGFF
jgi:hypothetical protein